LVAELANHVSPIALGEVISEGGNFVPDLLVFVAVMSIVLLELLLSVIFFRVCFCVVVASQQLTWANI